VDWTLEAVLTITCILQQKALPSPTTRKTSNPLAVAIAVHISVGIHAQPPLVLCTPKGNKTVTSIYNLEGLLIPSLLVLCSLHSRIGCVLVVQTQPTIVLTIVDSNGLSNEN
jgi:hypothetical protein